MLEEKFTVQYEFTVKLLENKYVIETELFNQLNLINITKENFYENKKKIIFCKF